MPVKGTYFLICKHKRKLLYLFSLDNWEGRTNEFFVRIVYSGKLHPSRRLFLHHVDLKLDAQDKLCK